MNRNVTVILIMSILLISELTIFGMNKNLTQLFVNNLVSKAASSQEIQSDPSASNVGYVKYTLDLVNGTLFNGNVPNVCTPISPLALAYDPENGYIYVVGQCGISGIVTVINGKNDTVVKNISIGQIIEGIVYDPENGYIYVVGQTSGFIYIIDGKNNTVIGNIFVGLLVNCEILYDPENGYIYVSSIYLNSSIVFVGGLVVINSNNTIIGKINIGMIPYAMTYDPENGYIYVTTSANTVVMINGKNNTVIGNITVGECPKGILYDPENGYIYVANYASDTVTVINGKNNTVIGDITVGKNPYGIEYDPENGYIYVTDSGSNLVTVINGKNNTVIGNITVGECPKGILYDPENGYIYVANYASGTISIISTSPLYTITFIENGLPPGTKWSVTLNGTTKTSTTNTITFEEPSGIYSYVIGNVSGYITSPSSGKIIVSNKSLDQVIIFTSVTHRVASTTSNEVISNTSTSTKHIVSTTFSTQPTPTSVIPIELYLIVVLAALVIVLVVLFIIIRKR